MMPEGGSTDRNEALAELAVIAQNLAIAPEVGAWLGDADKEQGLDEWQRANVREMRRQYINNTAIPTELNQRLVVAKMNSEQQWRRLRPENDWTRFQPILQETLSLTRQAVQELARKRDLSMYDAALSLYSPGLDTKTVDSLFTALKAFLPRMIQDVVAKQKTENTVLPEGEFPMAAQKALGLELMQVLGFSLKHGRLDESHHPFCGGIPRDVRITTRYNTNEFLSSLMGVLHETGHALYEQNLPDRWLTQPVGEACGMAVHESQSLLMEMQVCRSREFIEFAAPMIRKHMAPFVKNPESLDTDNLARLVTRSRPGLIRVDADEVTYPAHIILRFEIERDLLEDRWPLSELPNVWNEKMKSYLGSSTLGDDKNGRMQDVHWPSGAFGYFPAYTFGAVIAAQLFARAESDIGGLRGSLMRGDFAPLSSWLREKIWSQGSRVNTLELVKQATGGPLSTTAFERHLRRRYL